MNAVREHTLFATVAVNAPTIVSTSAALHVGSQVRRCESSAGLPSLSVEEQSELAYMAQIERIREEKNEMILQRVQSMIEERIINK